MKAINFKMAENLVLSCMATGIAAEIIPVGTPERNPLPHLSGALEWYRKRPYEWAFLWIRVEGRMTEGFRIRIA